jgi:hypothetical protein
LFQFVSSQLVQIGPGIPVPVLLGEGIPLFPSGFPQRNFTLLRK